MEYAIEAIKVRANLRMAYLAGDTRRSLPLACCRCVPQLTAHVLLAPPWPQLGSTAIAVRTDEGVVMAVEKRVTSPLLVSTEGSGWEGYPAPSQANKTQWQSQVDSTRAACELLLLHACCLVKP